MALARLTPALSQDVGRGDLWTSLVRDVAPSPARKCEFSLRRCKEKDRMHNNTSSMFLRLDGVFLELLLRFLGKY